VPQSVFFVVQKGDNPFTTTFYANSVLDRFNTELAKGFKTYDEERLVGKALVFETGQSAIIRKVAKRAELVLDAVYSYVPSNVPFKVVLEIASNTTKFFTNQTPSGVGQADDFLSVWGIPNPATLVSYTSAAASQYNDAYFTLTPPGVLSGLNDVYYTVSRDGDQNYGHYVLLRYLLDRVVLSDTFLNETLYLSEVIDQGGTDYTKTHESSVGSPSYVASVATTVESGESSSPFIKLGASTVSLDTVELGQRIKITFYNTQAQKNYVSFSFIKSIKQQGSSYEVELYLPVKNTSSTYLIVDWEIESGSVPTAIKKLQELKDKFESIIELINQYQPQTTGAVGSALEMLEQQGLDRAASLLREGNIKEVLELSFEEATFSGKLSKAINTFGGNL